MTGLHQAIDSCIAVRRGLGYQLRNAGRALRDYADFLQAAGETTVTTASALRWAASREGTTAHYTVERLSHVRMFARHLAAFEPKTEVPPANVLGHTRKRTAPHIYSDSEVSSLLAFAARCTPKTGVRRCRCSSAFWPRQACAPARPTPSTGAMPTSAKGS